MPISLRWGGGVRRFWKSVEMKQGPYIHTDAGLWANSAKRGYGYGAAYFTLTSSVTSTNLPSTECPLFWLTLRYHAYFLHLYSI